MCEKETNRRKEEKEENERRTRARSHSVEEAEEGEVTDSCSDNDSDNEDRISRNILEKLGHSQELHNMLCNRHLREMIREIDSSKDPGKLLGQAMQIPIFTEFADECLRIVEPQDESEMVH